MRLAHRVLAAKQQHVMRLFDKTQNDVAARYARAVGNVAQSVVVVADNVAEFLDQGENREKGLKDFPCLAPPFQRCFVEWHDATLSRHLECSVTTGVLVLAINRLTASGAEEYATIQQASRRSAPAYGNENEIAVAFELGRWILVCVVFQSFSIHGGGAPVMVPHTTIAILDSSGKFLSGACLKHAATYDDIADGHADFTAMVTFAFMNCKNVARHDVSVTENPPERVLRRNKLPKLSFRTLSIGPMSETLRSEGRCSDVGVAKAMHICRGHFATYTDDKPLFGKYVGTVWKPMHVRGNEANGAVVKSYKVSPEATQK